MLVVTQSTGSHGRPGAATDIVKETPRPRGGCALEKRAGLFLQLLHPPPLQNSHPEDMAEQVHLYVFLPWITIMCGSWRVGGAHPIHTHTHTGSGSDWLKEQEVDEGGMGELVRELVQILDDYGTVVGPQPQY